MGAGVRSSYVVSAPAFSTHSEDSFPCCSTGPSHGNPPSLTSPTWVLCMGCSSPWAVSLGVPSTGCSPSEQCGPPMGAQVLPPKLLQSRFLSAQGHGSCQQPAPAQVPHRTLMGLALASSRSSLGSLALAQPDMAEASGSFQQKPPLQPLYPLTTKAWPHKPHTDNTAIQQFQMISTHHQIIRNYFWRAMGTKKKKGWFILSFLSLW